MLKNLVLAATLALAMPAAAGAHPRSHVMIRDHSRLVNVVRFNHFHVVGEPVFMNGTYLVPCIDPATGWREMCRVDPYTGGFLGIQVRIR